MVERKEATEIDNYLYLRDGRLFRVTSLIRQTGTAVFVVFLTKPDVPFHEYIITFTPVKF